MSGTRAGSSTLSTITPTRVLAVLVAVGAIAVAATTGDSWAVRSILVLVAGDVAVRLWMR
jgi:Na+/H+ antiporter NhaC